MKINKNNDAAAVDDLIKICGLSDVTVFDQF